MALANFFASGLLCLGEKLGPVLWQLPPQTRFDADTLERFLELLPQDLRAVEALAREHDARLAGRAALDAVVANRRVFHAIEVRHPSFADERYFELLRAYGVASCVADSAGAFPMIDELTAPIVYARLHGDQQLYVSGYPEQALRLWADRARGWARRVANVFVFFDNDVKVRAPFDALNLRRLLAGLRVAPLPEALASVTEEAREVWPAWQEGARSPAK